MLESSKVLKVVSSLVIGLSLVGVGANAVQATSFVAPKLGTAEVAPTNPSIKKGDKIFVVVKDTKNQKVTMGSTYTAKAVKKGHSTKIVRINKSQWLNTKDVVKD
ncbi:hypothetical protein EFM11_02905 [Lactobacillus helveticus]|uniref:hypothetical protein n=1 Tax=Lactobacillus helveticus TaxID=1587 RepID=UPI0021824ACE|nr:hypothetical protein [Lactobacillus helveticus]MCT0164493.1 hypothetical protein [Lactobacillus helveticus]MCT0192759.1 hypothetical protein [Lactobacillus helveticus]